MTSAKQIPLFKVYMSQDAPDEVAKTLMSGFIGQGPKVEEFEQELKTRFNRDYVLTTNSATSAEHLALHMLKHDPEIVYKRTVLSTPLTCSATNWPILAAGYDIKWVDINHQDFNVNYDDLERKITHDTGIIVLVHWGGMPCDMARIEDIKDRTFQKFGFRPVVIEDCAHSFGSTYKGAQLGTVYDNISFFSFQAIKHLTAGDGGCLVVNDQKMYKRGKLLRWYGIDRENNTKDFRCEADIEEWGFKYHMNDINATIGLANLKHIDKIIARHQSNAAFYNQELRSVPGVDLHVPNAESSPAYWIYSMMVEDKTNFMRHMKEKGIAVSQVHERNDIHTCVRQYTAHLPTLDYVQPRLISIPVGWWVTDEDREYIVNSIKEGW